MIEENNNCNVAFQNPEGNMVLEAGLCFTRYIKCIESYRRNCNSL